MAVSVRMEANGDIILSGVNGDALKVIENDNGTLETVFLARGAWALSGNNKPFAADRRASITDYKQSPPNYKTMKDPFEYLDPASRGMTVEDSTERAAGKVYLDTWSSYDSADCGGYSELEAVVRQVIASGKGRQTVYRIGGKVKNKADSGEFDVHGVPLCRMFAHLCVQEGVLTPQQAYGL